MLKRNRPKGAKVAKKKKEKSDNIQPFGKLTLSEKETTFLRCLTSDFCASEALP